MRTKLVLTVVFIAAQLLIALTPIIPGLKQILPDQPTAKEQLDTQLMLLGFQIAVLTCFIGLWFLMQKHEQVEFQAEVKSALPGVSIMQLRDDDFYAEFLAAAKTAKSEVCIMYLAPYPPDSTRHEYRHDYYEQLTKLIRNNRSIRFRRIARITQQTQPWIASLLRELTDCPNADLAILKEQEKEDMPLAMSVQIIDNHKVWLVALAAHERRGEFRDISIDSDVLAKGMAAYYNRLWERSDTILDSGRITLSGQKFLNNYNKT